MHRCWEISDSKGTHVWVGPDLELDARLELCKYKSTSDGHMGQIQGYLWNWFHPLGYKDATLEKYLKLKQIFGSVLQTSVWRKNRQGPGNIVSGYLGNTSANIGNKLANLKKYKNIQFQL